MRFAGRLTLLLISCFLASACAEETNLPHYAIARASGPIVIDGKLDEADWSKAESVGDFQFPWHSTGKKEQTVAKMLWDDTYLYVSYRCEDAHISATRTKIGSDVWFDDCVEVFASPNPDNVDDYYNIEMNVNGVYLDGHHPQGVGTSAKPRWHAEGIQIATTVKGTKNDDSDTDEYWILEAAIPLAVYKESTKHTPPKPGDIWRLGLNRCGGKTNEQFSQWSPSNTPKPQFHSPKDFGKVTFSDKVVK